MDGLVKTYSEMVAIPSFEGRYNYLKIGDKVGRATFGSDRYLNQKFYQTDPEWLSLRDDIIIRDKACDLAVPGLELMDYIIVHHINPITVQDIINRTDKLLNPENLVCTSLHVHNGIHYGSELIKVAPLVERFKNDTCPWKR